MNPINFYRKALQNPKTRTIAILLTVIYILSPIDILPDFIPFLGQIDDLALLVVFGTELYKLWRDNKKPRFHDAQSFKRKS